MSEAYSSLQDFTRNVRSAVFRGGPAASPLVGGPPIGPNPGDTLIGCRNITNDLGTSADVLAEASILSNGQVQLSLTDTTGGFVVVTWVAA